MALERLRDVVSNSRDSAESRAYLDELWRRLRMFSKRSAAIPSQERGSFEWLSAAGAFWRSAREEAGTSREAVAEHLGVSVNQVRFLELGLITPHELSERSLRAYAGALGDLTLYDRYRERFLP